MDPYSTIDSLAADLRTGRVTAVELAERSFERIAALDPRLSAFVSVTRDRALREARAADDRLARDPEAPLLCGIPYAAKDIFDVAGEVTQGGCPMLAENRAAQDSNAVERLSAAGMVLVGKTRTSPLACEIAGLNNSETPSRNPWAEEPHVAGGSSSGSGVAVAAGMVPVALGSDTGGSVRVPAALCGITGHKTTLGRVGRGGMLPLSESMDTVGPLARTARDAALVFDALVGSDPRDGSTHSVAGPVTPKPLQDCRIAVPEGIFFDGVDAQVEAAVRAVADLLGDLGATVERREIDLFDRVADLVERDQLLDGEAWRNNGSLLEAWGANRDPLTDWIMGGREISDDRLEHCRAVQRLMQDDFAGIAEGVDAFLAPTVRSTTRSIAAVKADYSDHGRRYVRNTEIGNFLNLCGLSLPCGLDDQGRPIGAMLMAAPFTDEALLAIGQALQSSGAMPVLSPPLAG